MESDKKNPDGVKKNPFDDLSKEELITKCKGLLAIAQKAKQAKSEFQNQTETYKQQLEKCETEKNTYLQNNKTLQELVDSLTEQKLNYITEIDGAQAKVKALGEKCHSFEEDINRLKADIIIKEQNIADISQKLSNFDSEIISLKRQNNRLVEENEQLITQLSDMEARIAEFNNIGLQQREQLEILEQKFQSDDSSELQIKELNEKIKELEHNIEIKVSSYEEKVVLLDNKAKEMTFLYESEKNKKEKVNVKLRSYKDKILKCAACISQLQNSRFILSKTVKEYSENVPKWQEEIIKASKVLDKQINELNNKNVSLKDEILDLRNQLMDAKNNCNLVDHQRLMNELSDENKGLKNKLCDLEKQVCESTKTNLKNKKKNNTVSLKQHKSVKSQLDESVKENKVLHEKVNDLTKTINKVNKENAELKANIEQLEEGNSRIGEFLERGLNSGTIDMLKLEINNLETERKNLIKEKIISTDVVAVLETQNKNYVIEVDSMKEDISKKESQIEKLSQEISTLKENNNKAKDAEINQIEKTKLISLQDMNDKLKKEYEDLLDLNGLLREEVETLKLSLEQPKDDSEHLSDLNVSLQADIVKLETKLSAYKQENASLLTETKELRAKVMDYDNIVSECEDSKSKLLSYKTENTELLNEMKEINEVLKERGEAISKLQKAVSEMEKLIESLEKDRDQMKEEREDLVRKIESLECDLKTANQVTSQNSDDMKKITLEKDNASQMLLDKEIIIANLKEDVERLKQQTFTSASELPGDDMSTSTISKAEEHSRMKDLDETFEDKYTKLRMFALKLKRKLKEVTAQLQNTEQENLRLKKMLDESVCGDQNKTIATSDSDDVDGASKTVEKTTEIVELNAKVKSLSHALDVSKISLEKLKRFEAQLETKEQQINAEKEAHKATKEQLEKALRDVKKKNVLSLEMEDYERSMKDLTTKMEENKKKIIQMESTIDTQEGTINAMKTQIKLLEEQIKTEETQNRLLREELHHAIEDGKEKENVLNSKKDIISKLMQDLEDEKRKTEESELEITALLSEKEKIIISLGEEKTELNNKMKRLEFKCADINEKLKITNIELADLKTEYTSYKVRAQAVLRQNQTVDHSHEEQLKEETAALLSQIETLTANFNILQAQYAEQRAEAEAGRKRVAEAGAEAARAHQRTARLQADLTRLSQQLESERAQHRLQMATITQCYKVQIGELENNLHKEADSLRAQLAAAEKRLQPGVPDRGPDKPYMLPLIPKDESDGEMDFNVSMIPREEGEGSESASSPVLSKAYFPGGGGGGGGGGAEGRRSPVPLERLLEEGVPDDDALDVSALALSPEQEIAELRRKLQGQKQRVKHVTVLLAESERECARMAQLSELLKGELRRARGDSDHAHNTEYIKNVTFKFLTLPPGDERTRLIPVLQKILTLTPEETQKIQAVAKGQDPNTSKGWGSYLPWPAAK